MRRWSVAGASLLALAVVGTASAVPSSVLRVTQDRVYRAGVFLVVDAIVENASARPVEWAEVSVEFYSFFDELLRVEHAVLRPPSLGPGHRASLRVATPYTDEVRKIRYRFTWQQDARQYQNVPERIPPTWR